MTSSQKMRTRFVIAVAALLVGGVALAYAYPWPWYNPHMAKVAELRDFLASEEGKALSREERRDKRQEMGAALEQLTPEQRDQLFPDRAERRKQMEERLKKFFDLKTPEEKNAHLDEDIQRMEEMRQRFEQMRAQNAQNAPPPGGPPPGADAGQGGGPGFQGRSRDPDQRFRQRLDNSTPEQRAMRTAYREAMIQRRQQLGLPPMGVGRGGGGPRF